MSIAINKICTPSTVCAQNPPTVNTNRVAQLAIDTALPNRIPCPVPLAKQPRRRHRRR